MRPVHLALVSLCALASTASAQFIPGVTTTTNMGTFSTYNILNLTNGVGLSSMSLSATHSTNWQDMWISNAILTGWLQFDLQSVQPLSVIALWNYNSSISTQRGVAVMDVSTSVDGINFSLLSHETPPQANAQPLLPFLIQGNGVPARYVRFDVLQNYGNNYTGLSEVQFVAGGGNSVALATPYGTGCDNAYASFYETFTASTFDLSNSSRQMIFGGNGYIVLPGSNQWFTPISTNLGLGDDSVSGALSLGFTLNYPGGSTSAVYASSNGYVWAQSSTNHGCCTGDPTGLLTLGPRWCALWNDLNPSVGGTVQFDQDVPNGAAYVTFTNVPEYGVNANLNTFQFAFFATGIVELRWQSCAITSHQVLTGWSPGASNRDPGPVDISATPLITTVPDRFPLALASSARPQLGVTINLNTTNVPAGSGLVILVMGLTEYTAGLPLAGIGMPGCFQYTSLDSTQVAIPSGGSASQPISVPNNPGLAGLVVLTQTAAMAPGANALGLIASNGVRLTLNPN